MGKQGCSRRAAVTAGVLTIALQLRGTALVAARPTNGTASSPAVTFVSDLSTSSSTSVNVADLPGLTRRAIETPLGGATLPPAFLVAGYAFDPDAVSGPGVDGVVVYAYRNFGSGETPVALGAAAYGLERADVARAYGGQFASSGFQLPSPGLPTGNCRIFPFPPSVVQPASPGRAGGTYRISAFAHNVATGSYSAYVFADVSGAGPAVLTIATPAASATVMPTFTIGGWAIDSRAVDGTGVDAVALFTSANGGADPPLFLGAATYGVTRGDVRAAVGGAFPKPRHQLTPSG